jgi:TetR/AcrR family transcriptional regulator, cholesterol catabolism regulator
MARMQVKSNITKKEHIISIAANLIKEKGFNAASMRDIAENVGVEAASLYNHIHSKNELLQAICFQVAHRFMAKLKAEEQRDVPSLEKIQSVLQFHIAEMLERYNEVYVSDREWRHLVEPHLSDYRDLRRAYRKQLTAFIEEGIREGHIKNIDAPTAVLILLHAIGGIESWHRSSQKIDAKELEKNMITILISGLKK